MQPWYAKQTKTQVFKFRLRHDDTIPDGFLYVSAQERVILLGPAVNMPEENQSCIVT